MILGPVFRAELLRTARRSRYYALRLIYGALLLLLLWSAYESTFRTATTVSIGFIAHFAENTFVTFAIVQFVTFLVLIPPLFGGVIADEKQRKTLHYLMASRLSSGEIIADKVLGRAAHLAVFLVIGLPVVSALRLFGGVPIEYLASAYIVTISTAIFAVALSVLVSTLARHVKQAVLISYLLLIAWLFLPALIDLCGAALYPTSYAWVRPVTLILTDSSPFGLVIAGKRGLGGSLSAMLAALVWMAELQLGGALLFLLTAVWRLRPTSQRQAAAPARKTWFRAKKSQRIARRRWLARPACGADAVLWKERFFAPSDLFTKLVLLPAIIVVTMPLVIIAETEGRITSFFGNLFRWGSAANFFASAGLLWSLRVEMGWYAAFWLLATAGAASSSVTIEREEDTWISLVSAPLTGWQIVRAKALGAIWNQRGFGAVLLVIWTLGLITGVATPWAVLTSIAMIAVLTWLVVAIGIHASLRARSTSRSLMSTLLALCVLNGYPIALFLYFFNMLDWDSSFSMLGLLPKLAAGLLEPRPFVDDAWVRRLADLFHISQKESLVDFCVPLLLIFYVGAAGVLTYRIVARFDRWLDRPRISDATQPAWPVEAMKPPFTKNKPVTTA
jgi:ABC-type transport system involved in multi-copper enzyme maturation permease subunit